MRRTKIKGRSVAGHQKSVEGVMRHPPYDQFKK